MTDIRKIENEVEKQEKHYKKFFKKNKYQMEHPDLSEEDYLTPDELGCYTCGICHAPIIKYEHEEVITKGGVHCHKGCMVYYGGRALRSPKTWRKEVDDARGLSIVLYGDRRKKK